MTPLEHSIQSAFFDMTRMFANQDPRFANIFAIPNAGKRSLGAAAHMREEGLTAGVLDTFTMVPSGPFHGLWIEFKSARGKMSEAQCDFAERATRAGYPVIIARDAEQAFRAVKMYLKNPEGLCKS